MKKSSPALGIKTTEDIISVHQLTKSFGALKAVDGLSFTVKKGKIFGLLGANGAGKTTTLECILGLQKADEGHCTILGMDPQKQRRKLFEKVGVQFQQAHYQENIKVWELCETTAVLYENSADYRGLLKEFGLGEKMQSLVKDLSGGERQRLFIVLALLPKPQVVFLDELTTGLDTAARRETWKTLLAYTQKGLTVLLTSHFMDEVKTLCDEICILKKGKAVFHGSVEQAVDTSPCNNFEDAYLWYANEEEV